MKYLTLIFLIAIVISACSSTTDIQYDHLPNAVYMEKDGITHRYNNGLPTKKGD